MVTKADDDARKAYITRREDTFRRPYAESSQKEPRQFIMVGSTNERVYLTDVTGNTRYLPVHCPSKIDMGFIEQWQEQIFAEAFVLFQRGDLPMLPNDAEKEAATIQDHYRHKDTWEDDIEMELGYMLNPPGGPPREEFILAELYAPLGLTEKKDQTPEKQRRVERCLRALGYEQEDRRIRVSGFRGRVWKKAEMDQ